MSKSKKIGGYLKRIALYAEKRYVILMVADSIKGGYFNICFDCLDQYYKKYPGSSVEDIAYRVTLDMHEIYYNEKEND